MAATPFVVDPILTAIAVGYRNSERSYIADIICPRARVSKQAFKYTRYPLAEAYTVPDTRVGRLGEPNSIAVTGTQDTGATENYGLQGPIPQEDLDIDAGQHNIRGRTTERLTDLLLLDREQRVAKFYSDPANYDSSLTLTLSGSSRFSDPTSDPLGVLLEALDKPLLRPNTMALGQNVWSALRRHPRLVKAMGSTTGEGAITEQQLAEKLRISRLVVGESRVNTARPGQAAALERVWQSNISLTYIDPLADFTSGGVTFALTAQWQDRFAGEYTLPGVGLRGATVIKAGESVAEVAIAPHAGYLIRNAV